MKLLKTFIVFLLWDVAFYVMVGILIIAKNYANENLTQTFDTQYIQMNIGLNILLWFLIGAFIVFLFNLKRGVTSKNAKLVEFLVICIPALYISTTYIINYYLSIPVNLFLLNNMELMMSIGALVFGCEVFGFTLKKKH